MTESHGVFCWYELSTTDIDAACSFYGDVVGLGAHPVPMGEVDYRMWAKPGSGGRIGGVSLLLPHVAEMGVPPNWLLHVRVDDVQAAVDRCQQLGGQVHLPKTEIPGMGHFAILAAPDGASFGVYSGTPMGPTSGVESEQGGVAWHELMTDDLAKAMAFYGELFGWVEAGSMDMGPMGTYQLFGKSADMAWGGMMLRPPDMPVSAWLIYFSVPDSDAGAALAQARGAQLIHAADVPGGRVALLTDPQGATFALHAMAPSAS